MAAKKQSKVWISQVLNDVFESEHINLKEELILFCFPSKTLRKSGDYHTAKYLAALSHLPMKD